MKRFNECFHLNKGGKSMNMQKPQELFCQSCAMPIKKAEDFGTNTDGSQNQDYCQYCYQRGKFTESNTTM